MPIDCFVESIFNYSTLAECYKGAALDGIKRVRQGDSPVAQTTQTAQAA
jgi:hypothetical protein